MVLLLHGKDFFLPKWGQEDVNLARIFMNLCARVCLIYETSYRIVLGRSTTTKAACLRLAAPSGNVSLKHVPLVICE